MKHLYKEVQNAGGIAGSLGYDYNGTKRFGLIKECASIGKVKVERMNVGGIVGEMTHARISNVFSKGEISGQNYIRTE